MKRILFAMISLALIAGSVFAQATDLEMYYYKQENQEGLKKLVAAYTAKTGVKISLLIVPNDADATMSARAAQGKLPDILQMQSYARVQEYASKGYVLDLSKQPVLAKVVDSSKPSVTYNGKQYALPMDYAGIGIIYNKDIFAKYKLKAPTTARELARVCKTLKDNGVTPFAGLLNENWSAGHFITLVHTSLLVGEKKIPVEQFVADMNAGKTSYGVVDKAKLFATLDFYRDNMDPKASEWGWNEQQAAFAQGKAAMMVQGLWSYGAAIGTNPKLNCGFIPYPVFDNAKLNKMYADIDSCFGVSAQSSKEKQAAALAFLEWLATPEAQKIWIEDYKLVPAFKGANLSSMKQPFQDLLASVSANGAYPWAFSSYPTTAFEDGCKNGAQQYMFKKITADQVIASIDSIWAKAVKK
ncbi:MAG TPA: extracellular solute-binding protein [Treponemataceae bacterium]|nr:extracellular solute-binding protein [Treponemataceae bacterium]